MHSSDRTTSVNRCSKTQEPPHAPPRPPFRGGSLRASPGRAGPAAARRTSVLRPGIVRAGAGPGAPRSPAGPAAASPEHPGRGEERAEHQHRRHHRLLQHRQRHGRGRAASLAPEELRAAGRPHTAPRRARSGCRLPAPPRGSGGSCGARRGSGGMGRGRS